MTANIMYGKPLATAIKQQAAQTLQQIKKNHSIQPNIATILVGEDTGSQLYMRLRDKACKEVGITPVHHLMPKHTTTQELIDLIQVLNIDDSVHGILLQLPLPAHIPPDQVISAIDPCKDVEGFTASNLGSIINGQERIVPCTPLAILKLLESMQISIQGKHVVIINHSMVVGKPLSILFLNRNATVSICHEFTNNLEHITQQADILITAAGRQHLITKQHIKKEAIVFDVAIIPTKQGVSGDVDLEDIIDIAQAITPVPGGIGPVTVACAIENMVRIIQHQIGEPC